MNAAQRIIEMFGGQLSLAERLGKRQSTVQHWAKTGYIPPKWHTLIVAAAREVGVELAPADFLPPAPAAAVPAAYPIARWPGTIPLNDQEIPCYVLSDGRRVISRTGALNALTDGKGGGNLESYLKLEALQPFLPKDLDERMLEFTIENVVNKSVRGMEATLFIDICTAYVRGRDTQALTTDSQINISIKAGMILAAFAKDGIEAVIDEATGYQYERASDALRMKLQVFLESEMRKWEKTFPDELWIQFGRLTRWAGGINQRPKYWGKLVNELVYSYLDKDVYEWLRANAPTPRHGQNYHQWLSGQYGLKKLTEHIWMLIGMASACHDMRELRYRMAMKFGREPIQLTFYLPPPNSLPGYS